MRPLVAMACAECGRRFAPARINARYCAPLCARRAQEARRQARLVAPPPAVPAGLALPADDIIRRMLGR